MSASGVITTVAGSGSAAGFSGDGGPATSASLNAPAGVAVDAAGKIVIADTGNRLVRVVNESGVIATVAGNGSQSFSGDGGLATSAALANPTGVAVDAAGNLYIADFNNNRVRKVTAATGVMTTIAGNGIQGFSGDGGPATEARLNNPAAVVVDPAGNVYFADATNEIIRRIDAGTAVITRVAGNGVRGFSGDGGPATEASLAFPTGIALDPAGNLYIVDLATNHIRKVSTAGVISTIAGTGTAGFSGDGGPATEAQLNSPFGIGVDAAGSIFVADRFNQRIRRITASGVISTVVGTGTAGFSGDGGPATAAQLNLATGVFADPAGNLFIVDQYNDRIRKVSATTGTISTVAGNGSLGSTGDGGPATAASLVFPIDVAVDAEGNIFIADLGDNRIRKVIACQQPAPPTLVSPANAASSTANPTLSWSPARSAFSYEIRVDTENPPVKVAATNLTTTSFTPANLGAGTYYWSVVAKGDPYCAGLSNVASAVRSFTIEGGCAAPASFGLSAPPAGATGQGTSPQLSWQAATGASSYDVYLGTSNPPARAASGVTAASYVASGLAPGTTYYWYVVAHASCDGTKTSATAVQSFTVAGACVQTGSFSQLSPSNSASGQPESLTLTWSPSSSSASYDAYLGTTSNPSLYAGAVPGNSLPVTGLTRGATYYWKVVSRATCGSGLDTATPVHSFTIAGSCQAPAATSISFAPAGVGVGQTYVITWRASPDAAGTIVERSPDSSFATGVEAQSTSSTSASFVATTTGTYFHRVRPVASCGAEGASSPAASVAAVAASPNVVFTVQPSSVVTALGERLEDKRTTFTLENITAAPIQISVTGNSLSIPFFTIVDPFGQSTLFQVLKPHEPKTFELRFSGPPSDKAASYEGIVVVSAARLAIIPYAFVNVKVGGVETAAPEFRLAGQKVEYTSFPGFAGADDSARLPISVDIRNPGSTPMELAAEIGPEIWLQPEANWNITPIAPNSSRPVRLFTRRLFAPNGSALPRYTYFTVRTRSGQTARLLVQDNAASTVTIARSSKLERGVRSYLIPSVAHVGAAGGGNFISRVRLSNSGTVDVQAELLFTPSGKDGFGPDVVKGTVVIPKNDIVNLTDPLVQFFNLTPPVFGTLEVRAAPERIGQLTVTSGVDAPSAEGGSYGFQMPAVFRGEGARLGASHLIAGITATPAFRTNLILAETTGVDSASVRVTLFDKDGTRIGEQVTTVPAYGQQQINNIVSALGGVSLEAARVVIAVDAGGGSVTGLITVIDTSTLDAVTYLSRPEAPAAPAALASSRLRPRWALAAGNKSTFLIPSIVNGFPSFKGRPDLPYTFRSLMGFLSVTAEPATFTVTYKDQVSRTTLVKQVVVGPRATKEYKNVIEELFLLPAGSRSQGPVLVESDPNGLVYAKVYSNLGSGTLGDTFPVVAVGPVPSEALTGMASNRPIAIDGLEQSVDESRGTRSNVILSEVLGYPATVTVRVYEAGNRSVPVAEGDFTIEALDKVQLSSVFDSMGLNTGKDYVNVATPRQKDRTNVLCVVTPKSGQGLVAAVVTTIDNQTADIRSSLLTPTGGVTATGVPSIGF
ncbi:MAG: hypothetical protein ABIT01_08340 [Thermoanaerobaculia bacterium]